MADGERGAPSGIVAASCNRLSASFAVTASSGVLVVPNELYAKVQPDGTFSIAQVPGGQRKIVAWSPGSTPATQWVELAASGTADVELTLVSKSRVHKNKVGRAYGSYE